MGIEAGQRQPRAAARRTACARSGQRCGRSRRSDPRSVVRRHVGERYVHRDRHDGEPLGPQHHDRLRGAALCLGERAQEFGVTRMRKAGAQKRRLGDRIGDDGRRLSRSGPSSTARRIASMTAAASADVRYARRSATTAMSSDITGNASWNISATRSGSVTTIGTDRPRRSTRWVRWSGSASMMKGGMPDDLMRLPREQSEFRPDAGRLTHGQRERFSGQGSPPLLALCGSGVGWFVVLSHEIADIHRSATAAERAELEADEDLLNRIFVAVLAEIDGVAEPERIALVDIAEADPGRGPACRRPDYSARRRSHRYCRSRNTLDCPRTPSRTSRKPIAGCSS